jgi:hypothetical protein
MTLRGEEARKFGGNERPSPNFVDDVVFEGHVWKIWGLREEEEA